MSWNIMEQKHLIDCFGSRYLSFFLKKHVQEWQFDSHDLINPINLR